MHKLLIVGVDEIVGANLALAIGDRCEVVGLHHPSYPVSLEGCRTRPLNVDDLASLADCVAEEKPQWIVHCGPLSRSSWDLVDSPASSEQEAEAPIALAEIALRSGAQLTVVATDALFTGPRMFHDEASPAEATGTVAECLRRIEQALSNGPSLIVRTHAFGWSALAERPGFAESIWKTLAEADACEVDSVRHATPILATDLAELLWQAYRRRWQGVYHLAGAERTSPYRFAVELATATGLADAERLLQMPILRSQRDETSLNTYRARRELRMPMPLLREGLLRFAAQLDDGYVDRLRGQTLATTGGRTA